mmetsp:Transcript_9820/g.8644  ORF Transcript_9820/g.8644 Transcript_9820/m.8644 type:complete len:257 (+) Transcript_9820:303-1073(+)
MKEKEYGARILTYNKYLNPKKSVTKNMNLLLQRQNNIDTNVGELDVRHSFHRAIKTLDYNSSRGEYPREARQMRSSAIGSHFKSQINQSSESGSASIRAPSSKFTIRQHLDKFLTNSPSRQGRRILKMNPVYQSKYVAQTKEIKEGLPRYTEELKGKTRTFPKLKHINSSQVRERLKYNMIKQRINKSQDHTSRPKVPILHSIKNMNVMSKVRYDDISTRGTLKLNSSSILKLSSSKRPSLIKKNARELEFSAMFE